MDQLRVQELVQAEQRTVIAARRIGYSHSHAQITRMWANAQPDGRPAEHRWRPLVNAAKFG